MKSDRPIREFVAEAEDILETANQTLLAIEDSLEAGVTDADQVNALFRALHSFKGLAGMFGLQVLADLPHQLEFLLDEVRLGRVGLVRGTLDALADSVGLLGRLVRQPAKGAPFEDTAAAMGLIERVRATKAAATDDSALLAQVTLEPGVLQVLSEYEEHRLKENIREGKNLFLAKVAFSFDAFPGVGQSAGPAK